MKIEIELNEAQEKVMQEISFKDSLPVPELAKKVIVGFLIKAKQAFVAEELSK